MKIDPPKRVWVTKHCLAHGIREIDANYIFDEGLTIFNSPRGYFVKNERKNEWHLTKEDAIAQAESVRAAKIASLKQQIERLSALVFE